MKRTLMAVALPFLVSGCYSFQGPERLIGKDARPSELTTSDVKMFEADFARALAARQANPYATNQEVYPMLRSGFMYNRSFCGNWFNQMVQNQRKSQIFRGTIQPITTVITGIIGLTNFANSPGSKEDLVGALAVASAATTAGLNLYDQHFLFGAENFGAVKALTLKAQKVHAEKALSQTNITFEQAMEHLIDNQDQCAPDNIMTLARNVIQNAPLEATTLTASGQRAEGDSTPGTVEVGPKPDS
ncbi:hypothetical protein LY632_03790 [Erythrobacter sp. SDW2]|uniref:hypothetical protein n=1 Tax=Erythrobacter sp. SDW2 TaxID=2907154 RepID=UPI001F3B6558|nr:hypothetical protein [Erythrobacter sp. SDW2]UIP07531.1 hypothetical protein LY632_03790 [Erythrobacter sp. SDW2]